MKLPRFYPAAAPGVLLAFWALSGIPARAQAPSPDMPAASTPAKLTKLNDLSNRYRLSERYSLEDRPAPGTIGAYRVGILEVTRDSVDTPQGAPRRMEASRQTIFVERPAELGGGSGSVASTVRSFERFRARPDDPSRMMGPRPLEGLSTLIRPRMGELPALQSLTEGRSLTGFEFEVAARQVFVPAMAAILPAKAVRLGDTWRVPRKAAQAMLGDPGIQGDTLTGKFAELAKEVDGPRMVARISVTGKATGGPGDIVVNAEATFTFQTDSPPKDAFDAPARPASDVVEARGGITEVRFGRLTTAELPGPGRLRFRSNREVTLHRQLDMASGDGPTRPVSIPPATPANTWLTYREPAGKFSIQHPQDLLSPDRGPVAPLEPNAATMVRTRRDATELLQVEYAPKILAPEALKKKMAARWTAMKMEVLPGTEEWLPEADWLRMKVHRIEAAVKVGDPKAAPGPGRIHFDGYLIQFGQSASILAVATTSGEAVAPYRREVEQILKTIQIGPPAPR